MPAGSPARRCNASATPDPPVGRLCGARARRSRPTLALGEVRQMGRTAQGDGRAVAPTIPAHVNGRFQRRRFLGLMGAGGLVAGGAVAGHVATALPSEASQALAREDSAYAPIAEGVQQVVWSVATDEPAVALTFDDGPNAAFTPRVLDMLAAVGGRATFFVVGVQVEQERALVRRLVGRGSRARQPHLGPREPGRAHRGADQARDRARHRGDHARRRAAAALVPPAPGHGHGLGGAPGPPARPGAGDVERRPRPGRRHRRRGHRPSPGRPAPTRRRLRPPRRRRRGQRHARRPSGRPS